jgi:hypothetical protein
MRYPMCAVFAHIGLPAEKNIHVLPNPNPHQASERIEAETVNSRCLFPPLNTARVSE